MDAQRLTSEGANRPLSVPAGSCLDDAGACFLPGFRFWRPRLRSPSPAPGRRSVDLAGPPSNDLPAGAGTRQPRARRGDRARDRPRDDRRGADLTTLIAEKERTRPCPSAPRKTHSRALGELMVAGGLEMKLTAMGHTSSTAIRARSVWGSELPPVSLPEEGRTLNIALSEVCVTLRPRTTGFTTPWRCDEGRRMAVKGTLMLQTQVRSCGRECPRS